MSEVYCLEPPCRGRVVLHTTEGELDIRLWSTQCPKATRNFVQLCMEGFYNNCIFHRIIPQFLVQTGDPTGTGTGGESIYGKPFENEILSRLKFRYRGMVGMANTGGKCSNCSQFFITLERADCLNGKYTLFGKVEGHTIYNLMKIGQSEISPADDRPINPPKITNIEVISNPFQDIVPRLLTLKADSDSEDETLPHLKDSLTVKKKCLLSFADDCNSEDETTKVGKLKSAHDLLDDPRFSKTTVTIDTQRTKEASDIKSEHSHSECGEDEVPSSEEESELKESQNRKNEIEELISKIKSEKRKKTYLDEQNSKEYLTRKQMKRMNPKDNVMERLAEFTKKLSRLHKDENLAQKESKDTDQDLADGSWIAGKKLQFSIDSNRAYQVDAAKDTLEVFDPIKGKDNKLEFIANLKKNRIKGHSVGTHMGSQKW